LPSPGDIRLVDLGEERRLAVLLSQPEAGRVLLVLLSTELELATDEDVLLRAEETGLAYLVIAETDLVGPLHLSFVGPAVGRLAEDLLGALTDAATEDSFGPALAGRRGLPLQGLADPRRVWKEAEGGVLDKALATYVEDWAPALAVDPSLFMPECHVPEIAARELILQVITGGAAMGAASTRYFLMTANHAGEMSGWLKDAARAIGASACVRQTVPPTREHVEWHGPPRSEIQGAMPAAELIADVAESAAGDIHLATTRALWTAGVDDPVTAQTLRASIGGRDINIHMLDYAEALCA